MEMLIYISVLVFMLVIIFNIIVSITRSGRMIKALRNVENSARVSMERITREVRQAENISVNLSIFDSSPGKLVLEGTDASGNQRTVEFYLSSDRLLLKENGIDVGALTQTDAQVSSLFFHLFSGPNSEGIRIEMTIESGTSTHYRSENFYSSVILR